MSIFLNFLVSLDQCFNTLIRIDGEYGYSDETLSARLFRQRDYCPKRWKFVDMLFFWDTEVIYPKDDIGAFYTARHCELSYIAEQQRKHLPQGYRDELHLS
jgi:hypothetical protein